MSTKASFRFKIASTAFLPKAKAYCLDGYLEEGEIHTPATGVVDVDGEDVVIDIESIALVSEKMPAKNRFTLAIKEPSVPLDSLKGCYLVGHKSV